MCGLRGCGSRTKTVGHLSVAANSLTWLNSHTWIEPQDSQRSLSSVACARGFCCAMQVLPQVKHQNCVMSVKTGCTRFENLIGCPYRRTLRVSVDHAPACAATAFWSRLRLSVV